MLLVGFIVRINIDDYYNSVPSNNDSKIIVRNKSRRQTCGLY